MVAGAEGLIHDAARQHLHVGGDEEAVHRQHVLPLVIRPVRVAAGGHGVILIQRGNERDVEAVEGVRRDRLGQLCVPPSMKKP